MTNSWSPWIQVLALAVFFPAHFRASLFAPDLLEEVERIEAERKKLHLQQEADEKDRAACVAKRRELYTDALKALAVKHGLPDPQQAADNAAAEEMDKARNRLMKAAIGAAARTRRLSSSSTCSSFGDCSTEDTLAQLEGAVNTACDP